MKMQLIKCMMILVSVIAYWATNDAFAQAPQVSNPANKDTVKTNLASQPRVLSVRSLSSGRHKNSAVYGDYIEVKVENLDSLLKLVESISPFCGDSSILLCINDFPRNELALTDVNRVKNTLVFHLNRHSATLMKLRVYFKNLWGMLEINNVTVTVKGMKPIPTDVKRFYLQLTSRKIAVFAVFFLLATIISMIFLVLKTNIIRVGKDGSPFSLSQSQLAFWTLLVSFSIVYVWAITEEFPQITLSTLGLLGISVGTTAGAKMITYSRKTPPVYKSSEGFFLDILSDDTSVNIHRFQMMLWTIILGVIFIIKVIDQFTIPDFSDDLLLLMGISSGAYVVLKNSENKNSGKDTTPANTIQSEDVADDSESPAFG